MSEQDERQRVIDEALTWIKTPHHNGACIKGVGVDCGQFPIAVYKAAGLIPHIETGKYSPQFHLNRNEEWYLKIVEQYGKPLPPGATPKPADFVLYKVGRIFSHGAIVIDWPRIIHSQVGIGVTLDQGNQGWMAREKNDTPRETRFFTLWG